MSEYEEKFQDFIYLLEKRTALFSVDELTDLKRRISQLPNNIEQLCNSSFAQSRIGKDT